VAHNTATGWLRRYGQAIRRHWNSAAFRITLNYGLLTILTTLILLLFIYSQVVGVLRTQLSNQITHAEQRLFSMFEAGGMGAVVDAIDMAIADELDGGEDLYLLTDSDGRKLAGNVQAMVAQGGQTGLFGTNVELRNTSVNGYFKLRTFPDGHVLLIGHEAGRIDRVTDMIMQGIGAAVALALVLVVLGAYVFRREFERRVGALRTTARRIGPGQLSLRVPHAHGSDEFSHLNHDVNAMLDRIEQLMTGVRHVSDTIAHDLRTPLMRMQARLQSVQHPAASTAEFRRAVDGMAEEIDRLNILLGKLLQISELEAGVRRKAFGPRRLDLIAADVVDLYSALAEDRQITLALRTEKQALVQGDAELLANACANLIDNALKHARAAVQVRVDSNGEKVSLTVEDDGPGVAPESTERLGERFYRPDTSQPGLGLGLASVKAIVALHGGRLTFFNVHDGNEGSGLRVNVEFPCPTADETQHEDG